ncbi:hypothetical protein CkaCkLH20_07249 [Colletotrichum karsti]|uniref:Heterokaryon incompatibility domain-containing protein n=1 Tax=Colletotrichum karsti TaxID=1095194 RepID=A0A9P6LGP0_9PEZI|nr:uncharacterized protein CkaCkLH20_07249 [Colletotrichum karsti]KAF9875429.1 hypothetical protein CkaCkLH20_07249 [Colletotrichum karsti]
MTENIISFSPRDESFRFWYTLWDLFPATYTCPWDLQRVGKLGDGGKWICGMSKYENPRPPARPPLRVYSFGVGGDSSFEDDFLNRSSAAEVWGFDDTVDGWGQGLGARYPDRTHFFKTAVAGYDFYDEGDRTEFLSVKSIMKKLGHDYVDLVKMDIEGDEFPALEAFLEEFREAGREVPVGQLVVEIHVPEKGPRISQFAEWWGRIEGIGMRPVSAYDASAGRRAELDVEVDGTARFAGLNVDVIKAKTDSYHTDFAGTLLEAQDISGFNRSPHHTYQPTGESVHDAFAITMTGGLQAGGEKREHVDENLLTWMKWILDCRVNHWHIPGGSTQDKLDINSAHLFFRAAVFGRSFIVTEKGYFGFAPSTFYFDRDDYVRLLSLSPGEFDEPIVCDLKIASIAHLPQHFEALSYCWGDQRDRKPIILRGTEYLATASLITALRHLRYADRPRTLWVDALCINQEDTAELSHQILHMRNIYSQATRVLAWVGTEEWNPKAAFDAIRRRAEKAAVLDEASLAALYHFLSSPYWERLWVVQELALARDIAIVCGREILPWKAIDQLMAPDAAGRRLPDGLPYHMRKGLWKVRHLWHTRTVLHSPDRSLNFLQVLNKFNPCLCYLAKDKVYATLGMSSDVVRRIVRPDYTDSTTTEDVFRQATIACISEQKNLDVLALTRRWTEYGEFQVSGDEPKPPVSRVSWAGEWSTVRIIRPLIEPDDTVKAYAAAPCDGFDVEEATRHANRGLLKLKGVLLDMLNHVEELPNPYLDGWEERTIAWEPKGLDTYEYPTGENGVDAFWRTLLFDMAYSTFHPVHERLTKEEAPRYRQLYLEWTGRSESSTNENSFSNCLRWGVNFSSLHGWTFAVTETGYFVRTQPEAEPGDVVAFVSGSAVPLILRATQNLEVGYAHGSSDVGGQRLWRLVGSGYVHGMMDGEAFDKNPPDVVDILLV